MKENKATATIQGKYAGKMLTLKEASQYIRMGVTTLYECINDGSITYYQPARGVKLFNIDDLNAWLDIGKIPAGTVKAQANRKKEG
jgi:excisionase family DNA binding protein